MNCNIVGIAVVVILLTIFIICINNADKWDKQGCFDEECRNGIIKTLKYTAYKLDKYQIRWWIDFGTLLGVYREGGIIHGDDDVDIGIDSRDIDKLREALKEIADENIFNVTNNGWCNCIYKIRDRSTGMFVDLYMFDMVDDRMLSQNSRFDNSYVSTIYPLRLIYAEQLHMLLPAPYNIHARLLELYGSDYMTPRDGKENGRVSRALHTTVGCGINRHRHRRIEPYNN